MSESIIMSGSTCVVIRTVRVGWYYGLMRLVIFQGMSAVCVTTESVRICMLECRTLHSETCSNRKWSCESTECCIVKRK